MNGLAKPTRWPVASCTFAVIPAISGEETLVPPIRYSP